MDVPEVIKEPDVDKWELSEEIDEAFFAIPLEYIETDGLVHIWVPNHRRDPPREFHVDPLTDLQVTPLSIIPSEERAWLGHSFKEEIDVLQHYYKQCDIMWGLIVYTL